MIFISPIRWQWKNDRKYFSTRFFLTTFCKLFKLNHWEFPYITWSFSIFRKVFWAMYRRELLDRSPEKEKEFMEKKIDPRKIRHKIFHIQNLPLTEDYLPFPVLLIIRGRTLVSLWSANTVEIYQHINNNITIEPTMSTQIYIL